MKEGDVITAIDGRKVTSSVSLPMLVSAIPPGGKAELTVIRDKKEQKISVTVGTNKQAEAQKTVDQNTQRLGIQARALTDEEARQADTTGVFVLESTGLAAKSGIRKGDIIVSANGTLVKTVEALRQACAKDRVLLLVQRDGGRIFIPIQFDKKDEGSKK